MDLEIVSLQEISIDKRKLRNWDSIKYTILEDKGLDYEKYFEEYYSGRDNTSSFGRLCVVLLCKDIVVVRLYFDLGVKFSVGENFIRITDYSQKNENILLVLDRLVNSEMILEGHSKGRDKIGSGYYYYYQFVFSKK